MKLTQEQTRIIERDYLRIPDVIRREKLSAVFAQCLPEEEIWLKALFAYMPASDLAAYDPCLFIKALRDTQVNCKALPWGRNMDSEFFLRYVLPLRINNEDLTDHRALFFGELYPRVKDLTMLEAILEVNYWCLEKATYKASDIRTLSPLGTIANTFGRCGEESVLCVAALRSVGIPARQCYAPRWAHCDDNHAWVEVWVNGKWNYLGACEPEPMLNRGWFTGPASQAMLVHARIFGAAPKDEEVLERSPILTHVNVLPHYAPTKRLTVRVTQGGQPVMGAQVRFELINYAQLFPLSTLYTDSKGRVTFTTGLGDLYVHVSHLSRFMHDKAEAGCQTLHFELEHAKAYDQGSFALDLVPPRDCSPAQEPLTAEIARRQEERLAHAKACREKTMEHFYDREKAEEFAQTFPQEQREVIVEALLAARGNVREIKRFLGGDEAIPLYLRTELLQSLRKKDLTDTVAAVLEDHVQGAFPYREQVPPRLYIPYVLCPWIGHEKITAYRQAIGDFFTKDQQSAFIRNPRALWAYIQDGVTDCGQREYEALCAPPAGLLELGYGSFFSRQVLFVAACRTLGIPARLSPLKDTAQYWQGEWLSTPCAALPVGEAVFLKENAQATYLYGQDWTLSYLQEGNYHLLELGDDEFTDGAMTCSLPAGWYRIVTANRRREDDAVLAHISHFYLPAGEKRQCTLHLRVEGMQESAGASLPSIAVRTHSGQELYALDVLKAGSSGVIALIEPGEEPTEHLLGELLEQKQVLAQEGERLLLICTRAQTVRERLAARVYAELNLCVYSLKEQLDADSMAEALGMEQIKYPLVLAMDAQGRCVFHTSGYHIGTGRLISYHIASI